MKLVVHRTDKRTWKWQCNRWSCHLVGQAARWDLAYAAGCAHLRRHAQFGFRCPPLPLRPARDADTTPPTDCHLTV